MLITHINFGYSSYAQRFISIFSTFRFTKEHLLKWNKKWILKKKQVESMKNKKMRSMFKYRYLIASHRISWVEVFFVFVFLSCLLWCWTYSFLMYAHTNNKRTWSTDKAKKEKRKEIITDTRYSIRNVKRKNRTC